MDHPSLKRDNSILFKSSLLRTVRYNNFVLPTFLSVIVFLKRASMNGKIWNMIILTKILMKKWENIQTIIKETKQQLTEKD
jgi:hypothetical protein